MIIFINFSDKTTFHHLWDHKILSKRNDWILHVSEVLFGNRSRIENKLYIYTRTGQSSIREYWTSIAQMVVTLSKECKVPGPNLAVIPQILHVHFVSKMTRFENWFNFQNARDSEMHAIILSLFPLAAVWCEHGTIVFQGHRNTHWATNMTFPFNSNVEWFVFIVNFIRRFY